MFGRKGQSAMEYLMTYGWAILVVMVVGIAMWRLGIFNLGGTTVTATGFAKIKPQLSGTGLRATGEFTGVFTNGVGTLIKVKDVTIRKGTISCLWSEDTSNIITVAGTPYAGASSPYAPVGGGDNFQVSLNGCSPAITGSAGDVYVLNVEIAYDASIGGATTSHTESGTIRAPFEAAVVP